MARYEAIDRRKESEDQCEENSAATRGLGTTGTENRAYRTQESDTANDKLVWALLLLMGIGMLIPWNATLNAIDYFHSLYSFSFGFYLPVAFVFVELPTLGILLFYGSRAPLEARIYGGFGLLTLIMLGMPWLAKLSYWYTFTLIFFMGACTATLQSSLLGFGSSLPSRYNAAIMSGQGVAGIIAGLLRVSTKGLMSGHIEASAILYFIVAAVVLASCLLGFWVVRRQPLVMKSLDTPANDTSPLIPVEETAKQDCAEGHDCVNIMPKASRDECSTIGVVTSEEVKRLLKPLGYFCFVIAFTFMTTFLAFPGVVGKLKYQGTVHSDVLGFLEANNEFWWLVILVFLFNIFDTIGRALPGYWEWSRRILNIIMAARLVLIPCLIGAMKDWIIVLNNDVSVFIFVALLALSNGACGTMAMVLGPSYVESKERQLSGFILSFFPQLGVAIGSLISLSYR
eukprot:gb/GECG01015962.1/.p1 GENE.gb/GECG01015962.1/~~gb/GECG01015962.1/.p1  ORF type:complete len:456 (+),score=36.71 gb/GECG01015962.1/:1-1368(+)